VQAICRSSVFWKPWFHMSRFETYDLVVGEGDHASIAAEVLDFHRRPVRGLLAICYPVFSYNERCRLPPDTILSNQFNCFHFTMYLARNVLANAVAGKWYRPLPRYVFPCPGRFTSPADTVGARACAGPGFPHRYAVHQLYPIALPTAWGRSRAAVWFHCCRQTEHRESTPAVEGNVG
jgi:hypothetical protein